MARVQRTGLIAILLCIGISILWGSCLEATSYAGMADFKAVYYGARCLFEHHDPYKPVEFESVYLADGWKLPSDPFKSRMVRSGALTCINLPMALLFVTPFALLPWGVAHILWMILMAASFTLAAFLTRDLAGNFAPRLTLFLICVLLGNIEILYALGNLAGISIALCVAGVWCFLKGRYIPAGVACMAVALALKPHDVGLVWLYFLLVGGVQRKRALQVLLVASALALPALVWVWHTAPQWTSELHSNLLAGSARGSLSDPGPTSLGFRYADFVISLQSIISVFRDDPRFYNPVSYVICGVLLLMGAVRTLKSRFSQSNARFALAAIAALSLLPVYHRLHDAKLLLLTIPACALLWAEGGAIRRVACVMNTAAIVFTADIPSTLLLGHPHFVQGHTTGIFGDVLAVALMRPAALTVTALGVFYLCIYIRRAAPERQTAAKETEGLEQASGQGSCGAETAPNPFV